MEACALDTRPLFEDEAQAEAHFVRMHHRSQDGRFIVRLPFKPGTSGADLGLSRAQAARRFEHLRTRRLTPAYRQFMEEYSSLGHMMPRSPDVTPRYFIPHHPVHHGGKLRVVFDASAKTSSGLSLNDLLLVGPTIQPDLCTILLAFRKYPVAMKADIVKMYRQVRVDPRDVGFQTILWLDGHEQIREFLLSTVTYGISAAPFLAIRCLFQLATEGEREFPLAAEVIRRSFYVDDVLTGVDSASEAAELAKQLQTLLLRGQFRLSKWAASVSSLSGVIEVSDSSGPVALCEDTTALGILWEPRGDVLSIRIPPAPSCALPTKSGVLSYIASIFDPLGLLAPATVRGKLLMQDLWRTTSTWQTPLSPAAAARFQGYCLDLQALSSFSVPRWTGQDSKSDVQYVGFADASERACAACVFVRVRQGADIKLRLLCAKTQVAPVKTVSLPRLELMACLLLAKLMRMVLRAHHQDSPRALLFSDSEIVLSWLAKPAATWRCFVANRVAKIQGLFPESQWHHIPGNVNPADLATRGLSAGELLDAHVWWGGPPSFGSVEIPPSPGVNFFRDEALSEQRPGVVAAVPCAAQVHPWFAITNDFHRLLRIIAHVVHVCGNFRRALLSREKSPPHKRRRRAPNAPLAVVTRSRAAGVGAGVSRVAPTGVSSDTTRALIVGLSPKDFARARLTLTRLAQGDRFGEWIDALSKNSDMKFPKSRAWIASLAPFLDVDGVLRVGGRLRYADLPFDARHQFLLPTRHPWFEMWVAQLHADYFHAGPTLILNTIRRSHWPVPDAARVARRTISRCVRCRRFNPALCQKMGDLPAPRVRPAPPSPTPG